MRDRLLAIAAVAVLAVPAWSGRAQDISAPPCPAGQKLQPPDSPDQEINVPYSKWVCKPIPKPKPGAEAFPYPGDPAAAPKPATQDAPAALDSPKPADQKPKSPAEAFPYPGDPAAAATSTPAPSTGKAADKFPYPGDPAAAPSPAAKGAAGKFPYPGDPATPADSSSGSSPTSTAPSDLPKDGPKLKDEGSDGEVAGHHAGKAVPAMTPEQRENEDLKVAEYYRSSGNLQGAYLRSKDAVATAPDDYEAYFLLGEITQQMKKKDEAIAAYEQYLKIDPGGQHDKAARQALKALGAQ